MIDVDALLSSVDIVDVVSGFGVTLKKSGATHKARCPFHTEKTPSFHVNPARQFYHCFGCGANGDAIQFVREYTGCDFKEACAKLGGGRELPSFTPTQRTAYHERKRKEEDRAALMAGEVAYIAEQLCADAVTQPHQYLIAKGFGAVNGLTVSDAYIRVAWEHLRRVQGEYFHWEPSNGECLVIPMYRLGTSKLVGAQVVRLVNNEWEKKHLPGGGWATGATFTLGDQRWDETILVEGYATGLSVKAALDKMCMKAKVLVCFSAHGIVHAAREVQGRAMVFADNDASKTGERCAIQTGLPWTMAEEMGYDANDLHTNKGLLAVCKKIQQLRKITHA